MKIYNRGKFHQYSICGEVKNFQGFAYRFSIHEIALFGGGFGPLILQCGPILPKFSPEVVVYQAKTLFETFLKDLSIYGKGTDPQLALLVQF